MDCIDLLRQFCQHFKSIFNCFRNLVHFGRIFCPQAKFVLPTNVQKCPLAYVILQICVMRNENEGIKWQTMAMKFVQIDYLCDLRGIQEAKLSKIVHDFVH